MRGRNRPGDVGTGRRVPARCRTTEVAASDSVPAMIQKPRCGRANVETQWKIVSPHHIAASALLVMGAHPLDVVSVADRAGCVGLAILAAALAIGHLRIATTREARAEAAMWWGLTTFLCVATFVRPHLGFWIIAGTLSLAATSVARFLAGAGRRSPASPGLLRRRTFA